MASSGYCAMQSDSGLTCLRENLVLVRKLSEDEGWFVYSDRYFKVGERNGAGSLQFPIEEARIYGYRDEST